MPSEMKPNMNTEQLLQRYADVIDQLEEPSPFTYSLPEFSTFLSRHEQNIASSLDLLPSAGRAPLKNDALARPMNQVALARGPDAR